jgi:septal ring factor EnvC (AmiA/AmiB activator)
MSFSFPDPRLARVEDQYDRYEREIERLRGALAASEGEKDRLREALTVQAKRVATLECQAAGLQRVLVTVRREAGTLRREITISRQEAERAEALAKLRRAALRAFFRRTHRAGDQPAYLP